jgi:hypothetical protein
MHKARVASPPITTTPYPGLPATAKKKVLDEAGQWPVQHHETQIQNKQAKQNQPTGVRQGWVMQVRIIVKTANMPSCGGSPL